MYIERDAKIILIYGSIIGIVYFAAFYMLLASSQYASEIDNFKTVQIMVFGFLAILTLILIASSYSLKKEIKSQQEFLETHKKTTDIEDKYVKVPYNKSGLYSIIIASVLGIIAFLYLYTTLALQPNEYHNQNIGTFTTMIFAFIFIFIVLLLVSFFILIKKIRTPLYYNFKACPRCNSTDVYRVEYSWWGGLIGPALVHQVRCKKCGKVYDGATGTNVTKRMALYIVVTLVIFTILTILRFIL